MDAQTITNFLTPVIIPLLIAGMKKLKPNIPTWFIPILAPLLGTLTGYIATIALHNTGNLWLSAALGLAGVGVREVVDQLKPTPQPKD